MKHEQQSGRGVLGRSGWEREISNWRESGTTQREYCQRRGLSVSTFRWWRWRLKREADPVREAGLVELRPAVRSSDGSPVEVVLRDGTMVRVRDGFDPNTLWRLFQVLDARC